MPYVIWVHRWAGKEFERAGPYIRDGQLLQQQHGIPHAMENREFHCSGPNQAMHCILNMRIV
jgi:hypothetical protein